MATSSKLLKNKDLNLPKFYTVINIHIIFKILQNPPFLFPFFPFHINTSDNGLWIRTIVGACLLHLWRRYLHLCHHAHSFLHGAVHFCTHPSWGEIPPINMITRPLECWWLGMKAQLLWLAHMWHWSCLWWWWSAHEQVVHEQPPSQCGLRTQGLHHMTWIHGTHLLLQFPNALATQVPMNLYFQLWVHVMTLQVVR
jgi:hypothetical protein